MPRFTGRVAIHRCHRSEATYQVMPLLTGYGPGWQIDAGVVNPSDMPGETLRQVGQFHPFALGNRTPSRKRYGTPVSRTISGAETSVSRIRVTGRADAGTGGVKIKPSAASLEAYVTWASSLRK